LGAKPTKAPRDDWTASNIFFSFQQYTRRVSLSPTYWLYVFYPSGSQPPLRGPTFYRSAKQPGFSVK